MHEQEVQLPEQALTAVGIPDSMMPSDEDAYQCFNYFFLNIHPYVPVLDRTHFYRQYQTDRNAISPLILEGIFACTSQITQPQSIGGSKWLALSTSKYALLLLASRDVYAQQDTRKATRIFHDSAQSKVFYCC